MPEPPDLEPWADAEQFIERALRRSSWVRLPASSRTELSDTLRAGWTQLTEEGQETQYDDRVTDLVNALIRRLADRGFRSGMEYKDLQHDGDQSRLMPPEAFSDVLRSLCPGFWPFC